MSTSTLSTDANALLFPAFLYGPHGECRRKMKAEAKKWTKWYTEKGTFPEPKMIPVPPGSLMLCSAIEADLIAFGTGAHNPHWFFYLVEHTRLEANPGTPSKREAFQAGYEAFACRYPWGALSLVIDQWGNSIKLVTQRLEAVLSFWEQLDTLRYRRHQDYNLADLMLYFNEGTIRMWVDVPRESAQDLLRTAIERMRHASEDEIRARMFRRLHEIADAEHDLKHRAWLKSPGVLEAGVADDLANWPERYENLTSGSLSAYSGFLSELDAKYPGG